MRSRCLIQIDKQKVFLNTLHWNWTRWDRIGRLLLSFSFKFNANVCKLFNLRLGYVYIAACHFLSSESSVLGRRVVFSLSRIQNYKVNRSHTTFPSFVPRRPMSFFIQEDRLSWHTIKQCLYFGRVQKMGNNAKQKQCNAARTTIRMAKF